MFRVVLGGVYGSPPPTKRKYRQYSPTSLNFAYQSAIEGELSVRKAAKVYGVPMQTLRDRVLGHVDPETLRSGPGHLFGEFEEAKLVDHITEMAVVGYPYTRAEVINTATEFAICLGKRSRDAKPLTFKWFYGFIGRWPELKVQQPKTISELRARATSRESVSNYFQELNKILQKHNLKDRPECIYNVDEKGVQTNFKPNCVVGPSRGTTSVLTSERSSTTTILGCGSAVGQQIPPYFVFAVKKSSVQTRVTKMDFSDESDIDSTVTPIQPRGEDEAHGQILESDSLSDFNIREDKRAVKPRRHRRRSGQSRDKQSVEGRSRHAHSKRNNTYDEEMENPDLSRENLREIYKELEIISDKLKRENHVLHERENGLKERERMLSVSQENLKTITDLEVKQRLMVVEDKYKSEIGRLEAALRDKARENKRLKDNFDTLKMANDVQKKELDGLKAQHEKLEKQSLSVQARLTNLQRKQDYDQRQKGAEMAFSSVSVPKQRAAKDVAEEKTKPTKSQKTPATTYEVLSTLLDWLSDSQLRYTTIDNILKPVDRVTTQEFTQEKVLKILPSLVEMLKEYPGHNLKLCLPCLQFTYWSLVHVEQTQGQQKSNLSSTFRRLGEELYRSKTVRFYDSDPYTVTDITTSPVKTDKHREGIYFRSSNLHVRLLSSLIILRTLSQVDLVAHVFDILKADLKSDVAKELFLYYQGTTVVLQFLKPVNKPFMGPAMDIFLQMSTDSPFLPTFLESCSNETWFRTVAMVLRAPRQDTKLLERLSIVLQKLSKIKANKRYFEVYTIMGIIQELLRSCSDGQAFLALNLKSILYNLNAAS